MRKQGNLKMDDYRTLGHVGAAYQPPQVEDFEEAYRQYHQEAPGQVAAAINTWANDEAKGKGRARRKRRRSFLAAAAAIFFLSGFITLRFGFIPVEAVQQWWRDWTISFLPGSVVVSEQVDYRKLAMIGYKYIIDTPDNCEIDRYDMEPSEILHITY